MTTTPTTEATRRGAAPSMRLAAKLLLTGQLGYILVTQFHTGGNANDHHSVFAAYAASSHWTAVHIAQFAAVATMIAGLVVLFFGADEGRARWAARHGAAASSGALALYGALQAVDGVALKQAVVAWVSAPAAEKALRFANAESVRWLEWGMRSYHDYALGIALVLAAVVLGRTPWVSRTVASLAALSGAVYVAQGWVLAREAFSPTHSALVVLAWLFSLGWMGMLARDARRAGRPAHGPVQLTLVDAMRSAG